MNANDRQVGGDHYRKVPGEQHWDRIWRLFGPGYFVGSITAYVERYRDKNGIQDLEKARHYIDKLIELETAAVARDQAIKAGVLPFSGPHPDGAVARAARTNAIEEQL
jgi:hypothetical protein